MKELRALASNPFFDEFMMSSEIEYEVNARAMERLFIESINNNEGYKSIYFVDAGGNEKIHVDREGRSRRYRDFRGSKLFEQIEAGSTGTIAVEGPYQDVDATPYGFPKENP